MSEPESYTLVKAFRKRHAEKSLRSVCRFSNKETENLYSLPCKDKRTCSWRAKSSSHIVDDLGEIVVVFAALA